MNESIIKILKDTSIFSNLNTEDIFLLSKISQVHEYQENNFLFIKGEISKNLIIVIDGIVSVFKHDDSGNEIVISYFNKYSLIAEAATLKHIPFPSSAKFKSAGKVLKIDIIEFEKYFLPKPAISKAIIDSLLGKVELLQQNIQFNLASNASDKILNFYKQNPKLVLDLKQYEIASILNIVPETLSRNIKKLVKKGLLKKHLSSYTVVY